MGGHERGQASLPSASDLHHLRKTAVPIKRRCTLKCTPGFCREVSAAHTISHLPPLVIHNISKELFFAAGLAGCCSCAPTQVARHPGINWRRSTSSRASRQRPQSSPMVFPKCVVGSGLGSPTPRSSPQHSAVQRAEWFVWEVLWSSQRSAVKCSGILGSVSAQQQS